MREPHPREHEGRGRRDRGSQLASGADFADVAQDESIDTGSAGAGGDLGCIDAEACTVPEFEDALFTTDVGETSEPVQTEFGYHVIKVTDQDAPAFARCEAARASEGAERLEQRTSTTC